MFRFISKLLIVKGETIGENIGKRQTEIERSVGGKIYHKLRVWKFIPRLFPLYTDVNAVITHRIFAIYGFSFHFILLFNI